MIPERYDHGPGAGGEERRRGRQSETEGVYPMHQDEVLYFFQLPDALGELTQTLASAAKPISMHRGGGGAIWVRAGGHPDRVKSWARFQDPAMVVPSGEGVSRVPTRVLRFPGVSMQAKSIYALLLGHAQESTRREPASLQLCNEASCTEQEFWGYVRELEGAGLVGCEDRGLGRFPRIVFKRVPGWLWAGRRA